MSGSKQAEDRPPLVGFFQYDPDFDAPKRTGWPNRLYPSAWF